MRHGGIANHHARVALCTMETNKITLFQCSPTPIVAVDKTPILPKASDRERCCHGTLSPTAAFPPRCKPPEPVPSANGCDQIGPDSS